MPKDVILYDALGVDPRATKEEIQKAYLNTSIELDEGEFDSDEHFLVQTSYNILTNPQLRRMYDTYGLEVCLELMSATKNRAKEINDEYIYEEEEEEDDLDEWQHFDLDVSLKNLYNGCTLPLRIKLSVQCSHCRGNRTQSRIPQEICPFCKGSGVNYIYVDPAYGNLQVKQNCSHCLGKGYIVYDDNICQKCYGKGTIEKIINKQVKIEPGSKDGDIIKLRDIGSIVELHQKPDVNFKLYGNHLLMHKNLTLSQSLCGTHLVIEHLAGRKLIVSTIGKIINPEQVVMIENEGFPIKGSNKKGKLFIKFHIEMPTRDQISPQLASILDKALPRPNIQQPAEAYMSDAKLEDFGKYVNPDKQSEYEEDYEDGDEYYDVDEDYDSFYDD